MEEQPIDPSIGWSDAVAGKFIKFDEGVPKTIVITNWGFKKKPAMDKKDEDKIAFCADVIEEEGKGCEKIMDTTSIRLMSKLRPILEKKNSTERVKIQIIRVGDKFDTQYSVKELGGQSPNSTGKPITEHEVATRLEGLQKLRNAGNLTKEGYDMACDKLYEQFRKENNVVE